MNIRILKNLVTRRFLQTDIKTKFVNNRKKIFNMLQTEEGIAFSGFIGGFSYGLFNIYENGKIPITDAPLSCIFHCSLGGMFMSFGAIIVSLFLPVELYFVIPLSIYGSISYKCYNLLF